MNKFIGRKFLLAIGGIVLITFLYLASDFSETTFRDCFIACIVSYSAANVFNKKNE